MKITFTKAPPIGLTLCMDGQVFEFMGLKPHTRRDGQSTALMAWQALCRTCGNAFIGHTPFGRFPEKRNCDNHRNIPRQFRQ